MLPKWKQRKYILVLLFWVLSLYDVNEREVWSIELNDNIKKFIEEKNLTQQQLSDISGIKQPAIARIENGTNSPMVSTLMKMLYSMGYTLKVVPLEKERNQ